MNVKKDGRRPEEGRTMASKSDENVKKLER
jgi:hypothetical protein